MGEGWEWRKGVLGCWWREWGKGWGRGGENG